MGSQGTGSPFGGMKRLALALLVTFALNATPVVVEQVRPDAHVVQAQTVHAKDVKDLKDVKKAKDDEKDKDGNDGGGGVVTSGDGGSY